MCIRDSINANPLYDEHGNHVETVGMMADLFDREQEVEQHKSKQERIQRQRKAIVSLTVEHSITSCEVSKAIKILTETIATAIQVERASIWLLSENGEELRCIDLYEASTRNHSEGVVLFSVEYPCYFEHLRSDGRIWADDARTDKRTCEFTDGYLVPLGITSMLDVGIMMEGKLIGVICLEHIGEKRQWHPDEESFTGNIASLTAQTVIYEKQKKIEEEIRKKNIALIQAKDELEAAYNQLNVMNVELKDAHEALSTVNKRLKLLVEEKTEDIQRLIQQKDDFIHMLGHDLKNPMTPIFTLLPLIEQQVTDPKIKEMIHHININAVRMKDIIDETLKLARLNDVSRTIDPVEFILNDEIASIIDENKNLFDGHDFHVETDVDATCRIFYDKHQFYDLVSNFLTNAVKYTPDNEEGIIKIHADCQQDEIILSIMDKGSGLTEKQCEQVFEKFYKAGMPRDGMTSSGLGLSICKRIVEKHGGKIWVESDGPGTGCTFFVTIKKKIGEEFLHG